MPKYGSPRTNFTLFPVMRHIPMRNDSRFLLTVGGPKVFAHHTQYIQNETSWFIFTRIKNLSR